jgi:hypothetical protein
MALTKYQQQLRALLSPAERRVFERLDTPNKIQDLLDHFPANILSSREHTMKSPRQVLRARTAHCLEGAMLAAAALAYHGRQPLLLDLGSADDDYDHSVALFNEGGRWGAISKTNYPVLRWRDPVYKTPRELAMSYFHEYFLDNGKKTLLRHSGAFNLQKFDPAKWVVAEGDVDWVAEALGKAPHSPIAPAKALKNVRRASKIEIKSTSLREWTKGGKRR